MSHSLSQRYDVSLETQLCKNMVFYEYFMAKIKSLPWATDTDAQEWLCYMKELHRALRFLQVSMTNTFSVSLALHVCIILFSRLHIEADHVVQPTQTKNY